MTTTTAAPPSTPDAPAVAPPIPFAAIEELEAKLNRSLTGWDACPPLVCTGIPEEKVPGAHYFDPDAVVKVIRVMRALRHTKGKWARNGGLPLEPEPWQVVWLLAPVFGWKRHSDKMRVIRTVWDELPRKNGKARSPQE